MSWKVRFRKRLEDSWYQGDALTPLIPLSWMTASIARRRFRRFQQQQTQSPVPIIVVGNITVGGTGKTPLVVLLVEQALQRGFCPAVISRGYGSRPPTLPWRVTPDQDSEIAGDEPLLIAHRTGVPVIIDPQRTRALKLALEQGADLVISDDGLQHFALPRTLEIALIDSLRGLGNGHCLPAGPLREPVERLEQVDWVVTNGEMPDADHLAARIATMRLEPQSVVNLKTGACIGLSDFCQQYPRLLAVAGIGNPQRFFRLLVASGFSLETRFFADHHVFTPADVSNDLALPVIMTEKDAVKCRRFAEAHHWYLPVTAVLPAEVLDAMFSEARVS